MDWQQNGSVTQPYTGHLLPGWGRFTAYVKEGQEIKSEREQENTEGGGSIFSHLLTTFTTNI